MPLPWYFFLLSSPCHDNGVTNTQTWPQRPGLKVTLRYWWCEDSHIRCFDFFCLLIRISFLSIDSLTTFPPSKQINRGLRMASLCTRGGLGSISLTRAVFLYYQRFSRAIFWPQQSRQNALAEENIFRQSFVNSKSLRSQSQRRAGLTIFLTTGCCLDLKLIYGLSVCAGGW